MVRGLSKAKRLLMLFIILAECGVLLFVLYHFCCYHADYLFSSGDMLRGRANESATAGNFVDQSYSGSKRSVNTPRMTLDNGIYHVTVTYKTDNPYFGSYDEAHVWSVAMDVEDQARYTVDSDKNELMGYATSIDYDFYVHEHSTDVSIHNVLADNITDYLEIESVHVSYINNKSILYYFIRVLFWMLLFDLVVMAATIWRTTTVQWFSRYGSLLAIMGGVLFISEIPMMMDFIFRSDDLYFHCYRIQQLARGMESGMFPVKIQPGWMNGYGYATGVFYGDVLMYIPAMLNICGFPVHFCYKLYIFMVNCLTILISYFVSSRITGNRNAGIVGCVIYTLSIYRFCDLFSRAAAGEYTAMAVLPLVFYGFWLIYQNSGSSVSDTATSGDQGKSMKNNGWIS